MFANRLLALGVLLKDIVHKMGHHTFGTLINNYLHTYPFLQYEQLSKYQFPKMEFSKSGLASMLGISETRFYQQGKATQRSVGKKKIRFTLKDVMKHLTSLLGVDDEAKSA